jgi:anti-anti-sigma factor
MVAGAPVVAIDGVVDLAAVGRLHGELTRAVRRHPGATLVVDLDAVDVLDDAGLGILLGAAAAARDAGGDLEVVATRPAIRDRLAVTRFDRAVVVRDTIT